MRRTTMAVAGLLVGLLLVGCSDKNDPQPSPSSAAPVAQPAWSVRVQAVQQPDVVDGVVVAAVVDPTSPNGESVVAWDSATGDELWRHDGTEPGVFEVGGTKKIAYGVFRSETGALVLADVHSGEESVVAVPDGRRVDYVNRCGRGGGVCVVSIVEAGSTYNNYQLDESSMVLNAVPMYTSDNHVADGVTMAYERSSGTSTAVIGFDGDADHAAWSRPLGEMLGTEGRWGGSYYYYDATPWAWSGDGDVLLGSAEQYTDEGVVIDASQEFFSGGFAPDGTTLWTAPGVPCSGRWTTGPVQALCVQTGTVSYTTTQTDTHMWTFLPDRTDDGSYWVGVDTLTGEQKWRFPEEGTVIVPDRVAQDFAPVGDGYLMVETGDGPTLIDIATGEADVLDHDGAFLCSQGSTSTDSGRSIFRNIRRICDYDGNPIVAPWPTRWVELTGEPDGQGTYVLATASQLVAFDL